MEDDGNNEIDHEIDQLDGVRQDLKVYNPMNKEEFDFLR
jgi:hypothetical protein